MVSVGVLVTVGVKVSVGVKVDVGGTITFSGVLIARDPRNCSTVPERKDARWTMGGCLLMAGRTMKVKL